MGLLLLRWRLRGIAWAARGRVALGYLGGHRVWVVGRAGWVGHGRFEESFVVAPGFDEFLVELCEVIYATKVSMGPSVSRRVGINNGGVRTLLLRILLDQLDEFRPNGKGLVV